MVLVAAGLACLLPYKKQKNASTLFLICMMLICGFRAYDVGVDTHNYVAYAASRYVDDYKWGPIFLGLKMIAEFFPEPETPFLMLMSILTFAPLIYITRRYSAYPAMSVLMFIIPVADYFVQSMNIARQSIAIVVVLCAAVMIAEQKKKLATYLIILAFFFHPYTFPSVILLFFDKINLTIKGVYITIGISMIVGLVGTLSGIQEFLNMMMLITADSQNELILKLGKYGDYDIISGFSIIGQLSHMLPIAAMCILGANKETINTTYFKLMFFGCLATNIFVSVIFCERIASTFTIAQLLAVPYIYKTSTLRKRKLIVMLLLLTALLFMYNLKCNSQLDLWNPYHTIFD